MSASTTDATHRAAACTEVLHAASQPDLDPHRDRARRLRFVRVRAERGAQRGRHRAARTLVAFGSFAFAQSAERSEVVIELREFSFTVAGGAANAAIVLQAGQPYSVVFQNVGMMEHEVLIGRTVLVEDGVPDGYETNLLDAVEVDVVGDDWEVGTSGFVEVELEAGESVTIHFTLPADLIGTWEIGCFIPGHYQAGMVAPVVVE